MNNGAPQKIRVLVVDDSALMNRQITNILQAEPDMEVVGRAKDGIECLSLVTELRPDVITLDVEMPRMNGITALKHIMIKHSTPTVMISALTQEGSRTTFDALRYGAVDVVAKPSRREDENLDAQKYDIVTKVRRAAAIRTGRSKYLRINGAPSLEKSGRGIPDSNTAFTCVGAGTGGYCTLLKIIPELPADFDGLFIATLLVGAKYIDPFVAYLDSHSAIPVRNAVREAQLQKGICYIASSDNRLELTANGDGVWKFTSAVDVASPQDDGAVDIMLKSIAQLVGPKITGIILTGAGKDGAEGLNEIRRAGGAVIVQDINNCIDPSMPLAALEKGSVHKIIPDYLIADYIMSKR